MPAVLEKDYEVYLDRLEEFLEDYPGKFVLIRKRKVVSFFPTYEKALRFGLKQFGNTPFFIKVIEKEEESCVFSRRHA